MKILKLLSNCFVVKFFRKLFRKRTIQKRNQCYDGIMEKLAPKIEEKQKKQSDLIELITKNFKKDTGVSYESEFIPSNLKNNIEIRNIIDKKYGEQMRELNIQLNHNLKFVCI